MRTLAIGLDGFEPSLARDLMTRGEMPHLAALRERSARFELDHGADKLSGLAWEHVSSGVAPSDGARWSAVSFDTATYEALQTHTSSQPFAAELSIRTVVFDPPYWDLGAAPKVRGLTDWGAHDPGVATACRPAELHREISERFGPYPATEWIYGFCWPSVEKTRAAGAALAHAVEVRSNVARWLLEERLPDWDLAMVVIGECHSAIEPLWHGVDATHPLHGLPSAAPAGQGLRAVYRAIDALIGKLAQAFPDAALAVFAMHGMGTNEADVAAMALLPELLYRHAFGHAHMRSPVWSKTLPDGTPLLAEDDKWERVVAELVAPTTPPEPPAWRRFADRMKTALVPFSKDLEKRTRAVLPQGSLPWMPATRYQARWPSMPAFALPAFYDGRVRVNLEGREAHGIVPRLSYRQLLEKIAGLLHECREPIAGKEVVEGIEFFDGDPGELSDSQADLAVTWRNNPIGFVHPELGVIGPLPWRRTGGHTGECGFLYLAGSPLPSVDLGRTSSFDVVPTLIELVDSPLPAGISGSSLLAGVAAASGTSA